MDNLDFSKPESRTQVINEIKSYENIERKKASMKDYEVYNDNAEPYVFEEIQHQLSVKTAQQMNIISNLNIAKCVVNKEANIYTEEPTRSYDDISESDKEVLLKLYKECGFNSILSKANKYYKLRNQTFIQVLPRDGKVALRVLHGHNIDVVPDAENPEVAFAYVISSFDKQYWKVRGKDEKNTWDGTNQKIAEADDYKARLEKYQVWTKDFVFTMNGKGELVGEYLENPLKMLPFVDVAKDKDFEFFIRIGQALTDFTIDFNVVWSDLMYTTRLQGYSIGVLSGDPKLKPDTMTIGANKLLFLPVNPNNPESKLSFDFKNPTPNIEGQLKAIESLISTFLTTRGLDSKTINTNNGSNSYSSALERLMAEISQFKSSKEDFDLFKVVEQKLHKIVTTYLSILTGTPMLDPEYNVSSSIVSSELSVVFKSPEMLETISEKITNEKAKVDLGISDRTQALMTIEGITADQAVERIADLDERKALSLAGMMKSEEPEEPEEPEEKV